MVIVEIFTGGIVGRSIARRHLNFSKSPTDLHSLDVPECNLHGSRV